MGSCGINEVGNVYGRLTVKTHAGRDSKGSYLWECSCECGGSAVVRGDRLRGGRTKSCGCLLVEHGRRMGESQATHGRYRHADQQTPEGRTYVAMMQRCYDIGSAGYRYYGARGIRVCDRWLGDDGYDNFLEDMGPRPDVDHSIDRVDPDGMYEPENCRWLLKSENSRRAHLGRKKATKGEVAPLTTAEQKLVEEHYELLEKTAKKMKATLPVDEGISAGFFGLVKAIRSSTPPEDLEKWIEISVQNAIQDEAKREREYQNRRKPLYDPVDHRGDDADPLWEAVEELPDYLQDSVGAFIECGGDCRKAARMVGCSVAELKDDLAIARDKIGDFL
jgi:hypothetical protein